MNRKNELGGAVIEREKFKYRRWAPAPPERVRVLRGEGGSSWVEDGEGDRLGGQGGTPQGCLV